MPNERIHGIVRHRLSGPEGVADFFLGKFAFGSLLENVEELPLHGGKLESRLHLLSPGKHRGADEP